MLTVTSRKIQSLVPERLLSLFLLLFSSSSYFSPHFSFVFLSFFLSFSFFYYFLINVSSSRSMSILDHDDISCIFLFLVPRPPLVQIINRLGKVGFNAIEISIIR